MPVVISDEILQHAKLTEREALIEIACHLFDSQRVGKGLAARMAGLTRLEFEEELIRRGLPVIRYTEEMFEEDLKTLDILDTKRQREEGDAGRQ